MGNQIVFCFGGCCYQRLRTTVLKTFFYGTIYYNTVAQQAFSMICDFCHINLLFKNILKLIIQFMSLVKSRSFVSIFGVEIGYFLINCLTFIVDVLISPRTLMSQAKSFTEAPRARGLGWIRL